MADTRLEDLEAGFLARWSARKRQAQEEGGQEAPTHSTATQAEPSGGEIRDRGEEAAEKQPTDADMPPLETLDGHADYSGFLSPEVSDGLRRRALSQLFHSRHLNVTDGLDDYAEDFTSFLRLGDVLTADLRHRLEQAGQNLLEGEEAGAEEQEAASTLAQGEQLQPSGSAEETTPPEPPAETDAPQHASGERA